MQNPSVPANEADAPGRISAGEIPLILGPGLLFAASIGLLNILGRTAHSVTAAHLFPAALIGALASGLLAVGLSQPIRRLAEKKPPAGIPDRRCRDGSRLYRRLHRRPRRLDLRHRAGCRRVHARNPLGQCFFMSAVPHGTSVFGGSAYPRHRRTGPGNGFRP